MNETSSACLLQTQRKVHEFSSATFIHLAYLTINAVLLVPPVGYANSFSSGSCWSVQRNYQLPCWFHLLDTTTETKLLPDVHMTWVWGEEKPPFNKDVTVNQSSASFMRIVCVSVFICRKPVNTPIPMTLAGSWSMWIIGKQTAHHSCFRYPSSQGFKQVKEFAAQRLAVSYSSALWDLKLTCVVKLLCGIFVSRLQLLCVRACGRCRINHLRSLIRILRVITHKSNGSKQQVKGQQIPSHPPVIWYIYNVWLKTTKGDSALPAPAPKIERIKSMSPLDHHGN